MLLTVSRHRNVSDHQHGDSGAHITGGVGPTVSRSVTNLPGAPAITVARSGTGIYIANFGASVAGRYYNVIRGNAATGVPSGGDADVTPFAGSPNALFIRLRDTTGAFVDTNFYVQVW
ncbi:MAG: hypothetical protein ACRELA_07905 [Candidatus Rokuibacteriota bacterium]